MLVLDIIPEFRLAIIPLDTIPFSQFRHSPHEHVDSQLERIFSEMFSSERWTIVEPLLAMDERNGIVMAICGPPGIVMSIGDSHWSLSRGTPFSATISKITPALFSKISAGITAFCWKIAVVNLISQGKFYDNGAWVVFKRLATVSAILEK